MSANALPQGYENKVLTGDKLYTLVSLIKQELGNKIDTSNIEAAVESALISLFNGVDNGVDSVTEYIVDHIRNHGLDDINMERFDGDNDEQYFSIGITSEGYCADETMVGEYEAYGTYNANEANFEYKNSTDENVVAASYGAGGFHISASEYDTQNDTAGDVIALFDVGATTDGTIEMNSADANDDPIPVLLNGEHLATVEGIITALEGDPDTDTLLNTLYARIGYTISDSNVVTQENVGTLIGFNTAYNYNTNKVATMADLPDISGKQDALVFNTAYNASSNKVATMADIPSVSAFQTASDVQTAITTALSGITSFSFEIVQALPVSNISQTTIYLVLKSSGPSGNIYTEYAYVKTGTDAQTGNDIFGWEILGDTQADIAVLSTAEVTAIWNYDTPAPSSGEDDDDDDGNDPGL